MQLSPPVPVMVKGESGIKGPDNSYECSSSKHCNSEPNINTGSSLTDELRRNLKKNLSFLKMSSTDTDNGK